MTWVRVDDNAPLHPKLLDAGPEAAWLWVCGLAHCNRHHTDGRIAQRHLPTLYPGAWTPARCTELAERLVEVKLWDADGPDYRVHNYEHYQAEATREALDARREYERQRKQEQRARKKAPKAPPADPAPEVPDKSGTSPGQVPGHVPEMSPGTTGGQAQGTGAGDTLAGGTSVSVSPSPDPSRPVPTRPENKTDGTPHPATAHGSSSPSGAGAPSGVVPAKGKKAPKEPPPDTIPAPGTPARAVYDAIVNDPTLRPITGNPGDFALRVTDGAYPGVNVVAETKRAGEYASTKPGKYRDGRAFLRGWFQRRADDMASAPKPAAPPAKTTPASAPKPAPARPVLTGAALAAETRRLIDEQKGANANA